MSAGVAATAVTRRSHAGASAVLFVCLFAAQAGLIAVTPVLATLATDLGVSTAAAGQLRTVSGLAAGVTALALGAAVQVVALRGLLLAGAVLLAAGSLASAAAPTFLVLAGAQALVGAAVGVLTTAGITAAVEWAPAEHRTRVLSWALVGQAGAWIVGMPLVGFVGEASWRYGWLVLPLAAAVVAGVAVSRQPRRGATTERARGLREALRTVRTAQWATGELLANSAWTGTLVYAGALLLESYGASPSVAGAVLALGGAAYVLGNLTARRVVRGDGQRVALWLTIVLGVAVALFGAVRPSLAASAGLFAVAGFAAGARSLASNAFTFSIAAHERFAVAAAKSATIQFGYFLGSAAGGAALLGGYAAVGIVLGAMLLLAAVPLSAVACHAGGSCALPRRLGLTVPSALDARAPA